jgi:hypothetical protein
LCLGDCICRAVAPLGRLELWSHKVSKLYH